jgi:hypothetical protein
MFNNLDKLVNAAPSDEFVNSNFGKLTVDPQVLTWEDRVPSRRPLKDNEDTLPSGATLEMSFTVAVSELNDNLQWDYERNVAVRNSGASRLTDWGEIVLPSLIATFGNDWVKAVAKTPYVECHDVPNIQGKTTKTGKVFGVPKFVTLFKSRAACVAARDKRFGGSNGAGIPDSVVAQAKGLVDSVGEDVAREMLETKKPFGNYEADALLTAAGS